MKKYPNWVLKHKKKNIEIRNFHSRYYAYKIKSVWDKEKKRVKKVTVEYLGKITKDGIIPAKHKRDIKINSILEYGNIRLAKYFADDIIDLTKEYFPYSYETIIVAAIIKLVYKAPLKNFSFHYQTTYLKRFYPNATLSPNTISEIIKKVGVDYGSLIGFFRELNKGKKHLAIDLTNIFSESKNIKWLEKGHNSEEKYLCRQLQMLLMYSLDKKVPSFFKLLPGSIRDISSLVNAVYESRLRNVIIVTDKGFYSKSNINFLDEAELMYVIPVRRDIKCLRYYTEDAFDHCFKFRDRFIWYKEYKRGKKRIILYLDKKLKAEEETSFLSLVEKGRRTMQQYTEKRRIFGTLSIITNTHLKPREAHKLFKKRIEVECAFDALKNTLESDKTYMRSEESMRGYFFITFIALYLYCQILNRLKEKELINKYSVDDVLLQLSKYYKVIIDEKELTSEIPRKVRTIMEDLD